MRVRIWDKESVKDTVLVYDTSPYSKFVVGKNFNVKCLGVQCLKGIRVYLGNIFHCLKREEKVIPMVIYVLIHECLHGEIDEALRDISDKDLEKCFRYYDRTGEYEETIIDRMIGLT